MFVHLRSHSCYSFLEGLSLPAELAHAAASHGMPALALTDHRSLSGAIEFYDDCHALEIRPILGLELDIAPPLSAISSTKGGSGNVIVLLATDLEGWSGLCRLSSLANAGQSADPFEQLPFDELAANTTGLICLTGGRRSLSARLCRSGEEKQAVDWLQTLKLLFPGRLYAELQIHTEQDHSWVTSLAVLAGRIGVPTIATHDIHYLTPERSDLQRTVTAIRLNKSLKELPEDVCAPPLANFVSPEQMEARFSHFQDALANTLEVAARCQFELPLGEPHFPELELPAGTRAIQVLRQRAEAGLKQHYQEVTPELQVRLDHELSVIEACGYAALFLVMEDIIRYAHSTGVPISSRGSAASSLVSHCLGITSPDPVKLNLYFERFLNPARATPPDIDTDLCSRRRDSVIRYVYQRYGKERVAMVCTVNRFRHRSAIRDVAKAYGLPASEVSKMADNLPYRWYGPPSMEPQSDHPFAELIRRYSSPNYQPIFRDAADLIGLPRHLSIHPGGVVIAPSIMTDLVPTQMAAKGMVITQFDLESIERLGLVKIDLLGIRGLTVLGDVAETVGRMQTPPGTSIPEFLNAIPEEDPETALLVQQGRTIGCFQIESPGMRTTLKEIHADSVDDLMVALALYRPGPLTGGLKNEFVRRHLGLEPASQLHPALSTLLDDTYGVILYQEQVLRIAHELAGLSLADADLLRRAMSHFDPGKEMQTLKEKFISGALEHSQVPEETAEQVWTLMAAFAGYGFPKAHAASYAQVAWRSAWCKAHYPAVFMAAVLANWGGYYPQRIYLTEARRMGLTLKPPQINYAQNEFSVSYIDGQPVLFMGLNQVRELTHRTQAEIMRRRPFHSLLDFLSKVNPRPVEAENLVRCGALEGFGTIPDLLRQLKDTSGRSGQLGLFSLLPQEMEDWSLEEKVAAQETLLGVGVDAHPLELFSEQIAASNAVTIMEAAQQAGHRVRVAGMRQIWRRTSNRQGIKGFHMILEDLEGLLDVFISSEVHRQNMSKTKTSGPFVIEGVVETNPTTGEPMVQAERIWALK